MPLTDQRIDMLNPWWSQPGWESTDPHLRRLAEQPVRLPAPPVEELDLSAPGIHTLRGPRQAGKSTDLKLLARRALDEGRARREIVYLTLEPLEGESIEEVMGSIERAKALVGAREGALLLLDEVTAVERWQTAVKVLWDQGPLRTDVVVCTGSSAIDLVRGAAERLPGRRGAGVDHLVLPQTFPGFVRSVDPDVPPSPEWSVAELAGAQRQDELESMRIFLPKLDRALELYLRFGGLPAAVAEAISGQVEPSSEVRRMLWESLLKEVQRRDLSEPALAALLERMVRSLGSRTSWSRMAGEMGVSLTRGRRGTDYKSLRDYLELIAAGFSALVLYFWRRDAGSSAISKDKKLYFGDPLLHTIALDRAPGLTPDPAAQVENALAMALYRRYEPREWQAEGFHSPHRLHVWGTARGGEIDFVCGPHTDIHAVEVAYRNRVDRRKAMTPGKALPGRPAVVATKQELEFSPHYTLIPASLVLWALG